ncbi:MAG: nucleoside hydrolase [Chloroflexota bacterium]
MRMIIDTDAGIDDAEAILMALAYPGNTVEAITTVTGNVHRDQVNQNVCTVLQQASVSVPVYSGADRPLVKSWVDEGTSYHLKDGLGDWDERPPCTPQIEQTRAAVALVERINASLGEITLVMLGPLTNLALALRLDPSLPDKIAKLVVMGGAVDAHGNTPTVTAELNIWIDPEAAYMVFDAFTDIVQVGWEATLANPLPWSVHDELCALDTPLGRFYAGISDKVTARTRQRYDGHLLPDPLAMAVALEPSTITESEHRHVSVELHGTLTRGQTVVNYTALESGPKNTQIVRRVDMERIATLYRQMLA